MLLELGALYEKSYHVIHLLPISLKHLGIGKHLNLGNTMKLWLKAVLAVLALNLVFVTNSRAGNFSYTGSLITGRYCHTATLLQNGLVLVTGGFGRQSGAPLATAELYNPATKTWSTTGSMNSARVFHSAILLPNGKVLVTGGFDANINCVASAELYDPATGLWSLVQSMNVARHGHTSTLIGTNVLVVGGSSGPGSLPAAAAISSAELYNITTGVWTTTGSMHDARGFHRTTTLSDGTVLVEGGADGLNQLSTAELYSPSSGTWSLTGSMHNARESHTATLLPNGQVLVAGADNSSEGQSAELYNPSSHTWTVTGSLNVGRFAPVAALLPGGLVLVAGGYVDDEDDGPWDNDFDGSALASAEYYDPNTASWVLTGSMHIERDAFHTMTALPDCTVLVAGGRGDDTAEIYEPPSPPLLWGGTYANHTFTFYFSGEPGTTWDIYSSYNTIYDGQYVGTVQLDNIGGGTFSQPDVTDIRIYKAKQGCVSSQQYGFVQGRIAQGQNVELTNPLIGWNTAETLNSVLPASALTYETLNDGAQLSANDWQNYNVFMDVAEDPYDHNLDFWTGTTWIVTYTPLDNGPAYSGDDINFGPGHTIWFYNYTDDALIATFVGYP